MIKDLSDLNLIELLDRLEPASEPAAISLWPQTDVWLWLGTGLAIVCGTLAYRLARRWKSNAYRRAALREISLANGDAATLAAILRRTALAAYPRSKVAALHGDDWLTFLDETYGGKEFSEGDGRVLATAPYCKAPPELAVKEVVVAWVRGHGGQTQ